jgi:uncharacterized protein YbaP (TraB family)
MYQGYRCKRDAHRTSTTVAAMRRALVAASAVLAGVIAIVAQAQSVPVDEKIGTPAATGLNVPVWTATSPGHPTLLLVPTLHRLPADDPRINEALGALADHVQAIVLEAPISPPPAQIIPVLRRYGIYPPGDNITAHVHAMTPARLAQCARQSGQDIFNFFQTKPWLAAMLVTFRRKTPTTDTAAGGVPQVLNFDGIDQRLSAIAKHKGMPLIYLESTDQGFRLLSDMPFASQEALLAHVCDDLSGSWAPGSVDIVALERAWMSADAARLGSLLVTRDPKEPDAMYAADQYVFRSNTDIFARSLEKYGYFHGKGPILIAVGAGHFFGAASLLDRLRAAGYSVEAPQQANATTATVAR